MFKFWSKTKTITFLISLVCFLTVQGVSLAEDLPPPAPTKVHITASESGTYDLDTQVFIGIGNVQINYGDLVLTGDELRVDLVSGDLVLKGDLTFWQDDQEIRGDTLTYNLENGQGRLESAEAEIVLPKETGSIYLKGQNVDLREESYLASKATFTTCDLDSSHYHVATKELELYPGDKVIIRGVTYYEGKIPLFYWPYLVIPLDGSDRDRIFNLPVIGYGEPEGFYMKNTFNYYLKSGASGHLYTDLYSKLGVGLGLRHYYDFEKIGSGSAYFYGIPSQIGTENSMLKAALEHEIRGEKWSFKTNTAQEESWLKQELVTDNRFAVTLPKLTAEAWYIYKDTPRLEVKRYQEYGGRWSQKITDPLTLNLRGSLSKSERPDPLRLVDYLAEGRYSKGKHTLTLAMQQQYNPDLLENQTQAWRSVQRIPEFKWEIRDLGFKPLPLYSLINLGRYEENPSAIRDTRAHGQLGLRTKSFSLTPTTTLSYLGDLNTAFYGSGQRQDWVNGRVNLNQKLTEKLRLSSSYSQREVWGSTPFSFDLQKPSQNITAGLNFTDPKLQASLNGSYNFKTQQFGYLVLQSQLVPSEKWQLDMYANYDLNKNQLLRLVPMLEYKEDAVALKLGGRYLVQEQAWELIDARINLPLGETWQVGYETLYEPLKGTFKQGKISFTKDLHCRTLNASYDHVARRVALQYTINAFPTLPIGWDSQSGLGLFDFDQVSEIIGGMEK